MSGPTVQVTVPSSLLDLHGFARNTPGDLACRLFFQAAVPGGQPSDVAGFASGICTSAITRRSSRTPEASSSSVSTNSRPRARCR